MALEHQSSDEPARFVVGKVNVKDEDKQSPTSVLVADDDVEILRFVCDLLKAQNYRVRGVSNAVDFTRALEAEAPELVVTDLRMGDVSGLDIIAQVKRLDPRIAVVAITAFGSIETAVKAVRAGAFDYVIKPFAPEALLLAIDKALRERQLRVEVVRLREEIDRSQRLEGMVGKNAATIETFNLARRAAPTSTRVLIVGAPGTGKTLLARAIHALSARKSGPFVEVACTTALPESVLDEQLFGKNGQGGAFQAARGGTLLLEEVGELPGALQLKLLKLLQSDTSGEPEVRVFATSTRDLRADASSKQFREELYYKLAVVELRLPPLRDRPEDIVPLAQGFLARFANRLNKKIVGFTEEALKQLNGYAWPGNVRELENAVERAVALCDHNVVRPEELPELIRTRPDTDFLAMAAAREMTLSALERAYMLRVLERTGGNKLRAAQILGIDRKTIYRWLEAQEQTDSKAETNPASTVR